MGGVNFSGLEGRINIAIDGPVGCGKSTTARGVAEKLNYRVLDAGAMYRAVGYYLHNKGILPSRVTSNDLKEIVVSFDAENNTHLNGRNVQAIIKSDNVGKIASDYATIPVIREFLAAQQRLIVNERGYVAEGRNIGLVVMPDAELKIYLTASIDERVRRRLFDAAERGENSSFFEMRKFVEERDRQDMTRKVSPLVKCDDAIEVDTSTLSIEEQIDVIYKLALEKLGLI